MSAHPDRPSAVRVVEVSVDPLHAGSVAEAELLGGGDADGPFAPAVRLGRAASRVRVDDRDVVVRYADEKPLVVVQFPHLVLKEVEEAGLYCQPVACEMLFCRLFHADSVAYNQDKSSMK